MTEVLRTYLLLRELRAAVHMPADRLRRLQDARLQALARHAYEAVPYLRRLWDAAGVTPGAVRGVEDLPRVPFVTKDLLSATPLADLLARDVVPARCTVLASSGSGGVPVRVHKRPPEERIRRAGGLRILLEHGYGWRERSAQLQQLPGPPVWLQRVGIGTKHWISTTLPLCTQLSQLAAARATVVIGPPTALREVAQSARHQGVALPPARIVMAAGEYLDTATRLLLRTVLGADPIAVYGTTETGYLAWQCERRQALHVSADTHLVEILRGDQPAAPGQLGEIVVTDLTARTMPFLRYRTGDVAVAPLGSCACGRTFPVITTHGGRLASTLQLPDGSQVTAPQVIEALDGACPVGHFVVRQERPEAVRLELLETAAGSAEAATRLERLVRPLRVDVARVAGWPDTGTGKTASVISTLPRPF
jgi:phenylacetate-CoA ligase